MADFTRYYGNQYRKKADNISITVPFNLASANGDIYAWLPKSCALESLHTVSVQATNVGANLTVLFGDPANIAGAVPVIVDMPIDHNPDIMVEHAITKCVAHTAGNAIIIKNGCNPYTSGTVKLVFTLKEFDRHNGDLLFN